MTLTLDDIAKVAQQHLGRFLPTLTIRQGLTHKQEANTPCLVFSEVLVLTPYRAWQGSPEGPQAETHWLVGAPVEGSDPKDWPIEHKGFRSPWEALAEVGAELVRLEILRGLESDAD